MILITGATGNLGSTTIDFLLKKIPANHIAGLVRDESKAPMLLKKGIEVRSGNYDDVASLVEAFSGIEKLFFISGSDVPSRLKQHKNVIEAAKQAGVKHIIYTSFSRANETSSNPLGILATSHIETDKLIKASGIPYTIMLNGLYADVLPMFFGAEVLEKGIFLPAGRGRAAFIKREEIAEVAANILTTGGHEGKTYKITNTESYSFTDAAGILSELSGKKVEYLDPTADEYSNALLAAGLSTDAVNMLASFSEAIRQGEFETRDADTEQLLGFTPSTLRSYFKETYFTNN